MLCLSYIRAFRLSGLGPGTSIKMTSIQMSSLITGEWYMRGLFDGWGRPYEFNAQRMLQCGHIEEARDTVRNPSLYDAASRYMATPAPSST